MAQVVCSKCDKVFEGRCAVGNKNKHEVRCEGPKYECKACLNPEIQKARVFTNFRQFNLHLSNHGLKAQRVVAICNNCSLNFETKKQLQEHKQTRGHKKRTNGQEENVREYENVTIAVCARNKRKLKTDRKEVRVSNKKRPIITKKNTTEPENELPVNEALNIPIPLSPYLNQQGETNTNPFQNQN